MIGIKPIHFNDWNTVDLLQRIKDPNERRGGNEAVFEMQAFYVLARIQNGSHSASTHFNLILKKNKIFVMIINVIIIIDGI